MTENIDWAERAEQHWKFAESCAGTASSAYLSRIYRSVVSNTAMGQLHLALAQHAWERSLLDQTMALEAKAELESAQRMEAYAAKLKQYKAKLAAQPDPDACSCFSVTDDACPIEWPGCPVERHSHSDNPCAVHPERPVVSA